MTDKLHCEFFHKFDGKCCPEKTGCACDDITASVMSFSARDDEIRGLFWRAVLGGWTVLMVAMIALAAIALNH